MTFAITQVCNACESDEEVANTMHGILTGRVSRIFAYYHFYVRTGRVYLRSTDLSTNPFGVNSYYLTICVVLPVPVPKIFSSRVKIDLSHNCHFVRTVFSTHLLQDTNGDIFLYHV